MKDTVAESYSIILKFLLTSQLQNGLKYFLFLKLRVALVEGVIPSRLSAIGNFGCFLAIHFIYRFSRIDMLFLFKFLNDTKILDFAFFQLCTNRKQISVPY